MNIKIIILIFLMMWLIPINQSFAAKKVKPAPLKQAVPDKNSKSSIEISSKKSKSGIIKKSLFLKPGYSYLISFDERILSYRSGNDQILDTELLSNIFNDKQEILLKPKEKAETNLLVWTNSAFYNFDIFINQEEQPSPITLDISKKDKGNLSDTVLNYYEYELDEPPFLFGVEGFDYSEIDAPPMI